MKKAVLLLLFVLGISQSVFAQGSFIPERFTNRPLTLFNDATSVGWNPALLGIGTNSDLVLVLHIHETSPMTNRLADSIRRMVLDLV